MNRKFVYKHLHQKEKVEKILVFILFIFFHYNATPQFAQCLSSELTAEPQLKQ